MTHTKKLHCLLSTKIYPLKIFPLGKVRLPLEERLIVIVLIHLSTLLNGLLIKSTVDVIVAIEGIHLLFLSEVSVPSIIILNTSNEQYFLPSEPVETLEQLVHFINSVLDGSAQVLKPSALSLRLVEAPSPSLCLFYHSNHANQVFNCFLV